MENRKIETPQDRYNAKYIKPVVIKLNKRTNVDLLEKLNNCNNKTGYIKELIKNDTEIIKKYVFDKNKQTYVSKDELESSNQEEI